MSDPTMAGACHLSVTRDGTGERPSTAVDEAADRVGTSGRATWSDADLGALDDDDLSAVLARRIAVEDAVPSEVMAAGRSALRRSHSIRQATDDLIAAVTVWALRFDRRKAFTADVDTVAVLAAKRALDVALSAVEGTDA